VARHFCARLRRGASAFATSFPFGLTNTGATDKFFTTQLDMDAPLLLRDTRADFMAGSESPTRRSAALG
jgi:hypothetical protein